MNIANISLTMKMNEDYGTRYKVTVNTIACWEGWVCE